MRRSLPLAAAAPVLAAGILAGCADPAPGPPDTFAWRGDVPAGGWVRLRNLNGPVRVARAAGNQVVVTATKSYHRGRRPETVRFVSTPDPSGVTVCALWGDHGGRCSADGYSAGRGGRRGWWRRFFDRRAGVQVTFVAAVPAGVRVLATTVNGGVTVADAAGEVRAETVNGGITLSAAAGPVHAESVNGSVRAQVGALAPGAALALASVNGSVTALLPGPVDASVALQTVNGRVTSELPVTAEESRRTTLRGTMGAGATAGGGRAFTLKTVNGSVSLLRGPAATR